jgi:hypothetical protein
MSTDAKARYREMLDSLPLRHGCARWLDDEERWCKCQCEHGEFAHDIRREGTRTQCSLASCECTTHTEAYRYTLAMVECRVQPVP